MKDENWPMYFWCVACIIAMALCAMLNAEKNAYLKEYQNLKRESLQLGYSHYNQTNGVWEWNLPLDKKQ